MTWTWRRLLATAAAVVAIGIVAGLLAASRGAKAGGSVTIGFARLDRAARACPGRRRSAWPASPASPS